MVPSGDGESGTHSPVSAADSASTAVELSPNGLSFGSPPRSPLMDGDKRRELKPTLPPRANMPFRPQNMRTFSSAKKLPVLEPSSSLLRRRFDLLLLWILHLITALYLWIAAIKHRSKNFVWGLWYDWHAWPIFQDYMIKRDIAILQKIPRHVAVILGQKKAKREYDADESVRRAVEVTRWCAAAGIPIVTVYERTGIKNAV
jgi:dehydrodolichyl diphosphate syntase complex subunit NUS1